MALLNYTTQVDTAKTVAELNKILVAGGALAIASEYSDEGILAGLSFKIRTPQGPVAYRLPCNTFAVLAILQKQAAAGKVPRRLVTDEQAARVGWRIIKDWVEAQLALVQTQMVTIDQVFLPYAITPNGKTVYQRYIDVGFNGLMIEK